MTELGEGKTFRFGYRIHWKWYASSCRHMQNVMFCIRDTCSQHVRCKYCTSGIFVSKLLRDLWLLNWGSLRLDYHRQCHCVLHVIRVFRCGPVNPKGYWSLYGGLVRPRSLV